MAVENPRFKSLGNGYYVQDISAEKKRELYRVTKNLTDLLCSGPLAAPVSKEVYERRAQENRAKESGE